MIDVRRLTDERPLNLPAAADYVGKLTARKKPNASTLWRWCLKGCKGVKLESICIGGKRYVTVSAIERFIEACSEADAPMDRVDVPITRQASPSAVRVRARRREEIEAARRRLDELTGRNNPRVLSAPPGIPTRSA